MFYIFYYKSPNFKEPTHVFTPDPNITCYTQWLCNFSRHVVYLHIYFSHIYRKVDNGKFKISKPRAGLLTEQLWALAALPENSHSIPSPMRGWQQSVSPCPGTPVPFYSPREHQTCKEHIDTHAKHSCMQKIKKLKMYPISSTHWYVIITQSLSCCKALASPVNPDTSCQGPWKPEGLLSSLQANPQACGCLALHRIERTFSN